MLRSNRQTSLPSGTKFLDIGRALLEERVAVVVLQMCLSEKALMEVECNLETVGNGGKSALLNTKETVILYDLVKTNFNFKISFISFIQTRFIDQYNHGVKFHKQKH